MKTRTLRTVVAFLVAPSVASVLVAVVGASLHPPEESLSWVGAFYQFFVIASVISYGISYSVGTLTFIVLRKLHRESPQVYGAIGGMFGLLYGVLMGVLPGLDIQRVVVAAFFALLGLTVAVTFALIRRNEKLV